MALHHTHSRKIIHAQRAGLVNELTRIDAQLAEIDADDYDDFGGSYSDELYLLRAEIQRELDLLSLPTRHSASTLRAMAERE